MAIIEDTDIGIPESHPVRSKYRDTLDKFLSMNIQRGKIECESIAQAERIQKGLRRYRRIDEKIAIERRRNIIWLVKL